MRYLLALALLFGAASAYAGDGGGHTGGSNDNPGAPPRVYDAQGKYVGQLARYQSHNGVFLTVNGAVSFAGIEPLSIDNGAEYSATQFQWSSESLIYYTSADCSKPPIIYYERSPRPAEVVRLGTDVVLYVAGEADGTTVHASADRGNPNINVCAPVSKDLANAFIPETSYPLLQKHPEPLTIRP